MQLVKKIRPLKSEELRLYEKVIELGVLKRLPAMDLLSDGGLVSVNCGDENINNDRAQYLRRKHNELVRKHQIDGQEISEEETSLFIHSHCWNGGGMILAKLPPAVKDYVLSDIQATIVLKNRKTISNEGHWPCGKAELSHIDMFQSFCNLHDSVQLLKRSLSGTFRYARVFGLYHISVNHGSHIQNCTHEFDSEKLVDHYETLSDFWREFKYPERSLAAVA